MISKKSIASPPPDPPPSSAKRKRKGGSLSTAVLNSAKRLKSAAMPRRNNNGNQKDDASVATAASNSSDGSSGTTTTTASRKRQPNSFASATAASLARGCPDTEAPPARSASGSTSARMTLPKPSVGANDGEKENVVNGTPTKQPKKTGDEESTPKPQPQQPVLSPTPYWKVAQERGNKTSPRTTRSAAKKAEESAQKQERDLRVALEGGMRELEEQEEESSSDDEEEDVRLDPTTLHFSPPDRQLRANMTKNAQKRREAEAERERERKQKVRKAGALIVDNSGPTGKKRTSKRPKKGHSIPQNWKDEGQAAILAATGPSTEEVRQIMQHTLAEHNGRRIEELVAKTAAAERDANHFKQRSAELEEKVGELAEQAKTGSELQARVAEQRGTIDGYIKEILQLECEKNELNAKVEKDKEAFLRLECEKKELQEQNEQLARDREAFDAGRKKAEDEVARMKEEHAAELERAATDAASVKEICDHFQDKCEAVQAELKSAQAKLAESNQANEELERLRADGDENRDELLGRIAELQRQEAELATQLTAANATNMSKQETIESLRSDAKTHVAAISDKEGAIAQLQSNLETTKGELEEAQQMMKGMTSPRSRDTLERGFNEEVGGLEGKLSAAEGEAAELRDQLVAKDEEIQGLKKELDEVQVQNKDLQSQLSETNGSLEEFTRTAEKMNSENVRLSQQVQAAEARHVEDERQIEEIAAENEKLVDELQSTERNFQQKIEYAESEAQRREAELETKNTTITAEKESLDAELQRARGDISELKARVASLEGELAKSQQTTSVLQAEKVESDQKLTELSGQLQTLTTHLESAKATISMLEQKLKEKDVYCEQFSSIERRLVSEKRVLNEIRRDLHNRVIQLSGNIRVFVRVRPLIEAERQTTTQQQQSSGNGRPSSRGSMMQHSPNRRPPTSRPSSASGRPSSRGSTLPASSRTLPSPSKNEDSAVACPFNFPSITDRNTTQSSSSANSSSASPNYASFHDLTKQTIELTEPYKDRGGLSARRKRWRYGFDRVFCPDDGQDDVWAGAAPLVQSCVDGFHVCMFAYGQTGSGKTHTMIGNPQNLGLIPRAVERLFAAKAEIEQSHRGEVSVDVRVELLEIYNEEVRDLLDADAGPDGRLVKLRLHSNEAVGNVNINVRDEGEVADVLRLATARRCVKATKSNAESSRSHLLFTLHFDVASLADGAAVRSGCLHIVDLAGSERVDKSGSHGQLLTEAKHINASLSALALVIEKLQAKKSEKEHVPYRDSKLTYLLRNSLGGDAKTLAIVCCSPRAAHFNESLNSIRFAAKASKVELKDGNTFDF